MPRVMKPRAYDVHLTDHGWKRFIERAGPYGQGISRKKLRKYLHAKINNALGIGVYLDYPGAARVEVFPWLCAVMVMENNGWVCLTFKNDIEQKKKAMG